MKKRKRQARPQVEANVWTRRQHITFVRRSLLVGVMFSLCLVGLLFQIWRLQAVYGDEYSRFAAAQRAARDIDRVAEVFAPVRGGFVDRHNQPITATEQVFTVTLDPYALNRRYRSGRQLRADNDIRQDVFDRIADVLDVSRFDVAELLRTDPDGELLITSGRRRRVLQHNVPAEIALPLSNGVPNEDPETSREMPFIHPPIPEIHLEQTSLRWYPDPFFAPQVIGFTRGDAVWGLEAQYRTELEGEQGRRIWVQGETETVPVRDGYTIVTSLDGDIQRLAQYYVDRTIRQHPADFVGMIVMDPFTSEILAMAQAPTFSLEDPFNPEYFTDAQLAADWIYKDESERSAAIMRLWRNYHTTRSNEPGSTFKPFVIAAAIEEGRISRNHPFNCNGVIQILDREVFCWNEWGCGSLNLREALARSCNMAMVEINRLLGRDLFYQYRGDFGFGERTGINLPGEECVSSHYVMYPRHRLNPVEMATSSMGQGFNATTIQVLNGYAALINGGNLRRPTLVSQIIDSRGAPVYEADHSIVRRVISEQTSDFIRTEMRYVVSATTATHGFNGTARQSYIPGFAIGGKTGTAQQGIRGSDQYIPTYVAFLPLDNPQFLVLLTIDRIRDVNNRFAGSTLAPIMREFMMDLIHLRNIQPTGDAHVFASEFAGTPMPNLEGMRLADAARDISNLGTGGYQVVGGGTIVSHHWPAPGQTVPETSPVILYTDPYSRIPERMTTAPTLIGLPATQAQFLLEEAGLPGILFTNRPEPPDTDQWPATAGSGPASETPTAPLPYIVYQQFPVAGSEIEIGTPVILRAR